MVGDAIEIAAAKPAGAREIADAPAGIASLDRLQPVEHAVLGRRKQDDLDGPLAPRRARGRQPRQPQRDRKMERGRGRERAAVAREHGAHDYHASPAW